MGNTVWHIGNTNTYYKVTLDSTGSEYLVRTKIVNYNKNKLDTFEEQINKVLDEMEENKTIKDIKVLNEQKVLIIYTINKFI